MTDSLRPLLRFGALALVAAVLAGCASPRQAAPVEDRSASRGATNRPADPAKATTPPVTPVEVKPGSYMVKPGDTLMRIALENGQSWRDIARWNGIENPNVIEVGQVLRVLPPDAPAVATKPVATAKVEAKPLGGAASGATPSASAAKDAASATPEIGRAHV